MLAGRSRCSKVRLPAKGLWRTSRRLTDRSRRSDGSSPPPSTSATTTGPGTRPPPEPSTRDFCARRNKFTAAHCAVGLRQRIQTELGIFVRLRHYRRPPRSATLPNLKGAVTYARENALRREVLTNRRLAK